MKLSNQLLTLNGKPLKGEVMAAAQAALEAADKAKNLAELRAAVEAFEHCPLKKDALNTVFADGDPASPLMIIGEAPGAREDEQGKPFVGRSGQLLDKMLAAIGRDRTNTYISNGLFWRPPDNRTPTPQELAMVRPFVERHIALIKPKVLAFVGGSSAKFMLRTDTGITKLRSQWLNYQNDWLEHPIATICTFHPAYLLRNPPKKAEAWEDLQLIQQKLSEKS